VNGPPGVGKSLTIFGWLMHQSCFNNNNLWVHRTGAGDLMANALMVVRGVASYAVIPMVSITESFG
jgi:hypothetical protein